MIIFLDWCYILLPCWIKIGLVFFFYIILTETGTHRIVDGDSSKYVGRRYSKSVFRRIQAPVISAEMPFPRRPLSLASSSPNEESDTVFSSYLIFDHDPLRSLRNTTLELRHGEWSHSASSFASSYCHIINRLASWSLDTHEKILRRISQIDKLLDKLRWKPNEW